MVVEKGKLYTNSYGGVYTAMLRTPVGRAAFVKLVNPDVFQGKPRYKLCILFPKNGDAKFLNSLSRLEKAAEEALVQRFGAQLDKKRPALKPALMDGDDPSMAEYKGFPGCWYIQPGTGQHPRIVDEHQAEIGAESIIAGMKVMAVVTGNVGDKGVGWRLEILQLIEDDGIRYTGGPDPKKLLSLEDDEAPELDPIKQEYVPKKTVKTSNPSDVL